MLKNPECRKQVLRVAELQSDDYHLDRTLYYACRDAREMFCGQVHSGDGKVFECLFKNKMHPQMPSKVFIDFCSFVSDLLLNIHVCE